MWLFCSHSFVHTLYSSFACLTDCLPVCFIVRFFSQCCYFTILLLLLALLHSMFWMYVYMCSNVKWNSLVDYWSASSHSISIWFSRKHWASESLFRCLQMIRHWSSVCICVLRYMHTIVCMSECFYAGWVYLARLVGWLVGDLLLSAIAGYANIRIY